MNSREHLELEKRVTATARILADSLQGAHIGVPRPSDTYIATIGLALLQLRGERKPNEGDGCKRGC